MADKTGRDSDKFMLRLPDGMRDQVKESAEKNNRSMNAEVVVALEEYLRKSRFVIDTGEPLGPDDYDPSDDIEPQEVPPEVRRAMEQLVDQITDDAKRRLNQLLGG